MNNNYKIKSKKKKNVNIFTLIKNIDYFIKKNSTPQPQPQPTSTLTIPSTQQPTSTLTIPSTQKRNRNGTTADNVQITNHNSGFNINDEFIDIGNDLCVEGNFTINVNIFNNLPTDNLPTDNLPIDYLPTDNTIESFIEKKISLKSNGNGGTADNVQNTKHNSGFNSNDEFIDIGNDLCIKGDFTVNINIHK
jgi:hypothetical protein